MLVMSLFSKPIPLDFPIENVSKILEKRANIYRLKVILPLFQERILMQCRKKNREEAMLFVMEMVLGEKIQNIAQKKKTYKYYLL